jgi:hypothetical protein
VWDPIHSPDQALIAKPESTWSTRVKDAASVHSTPSVLLLGDSPSDPQVELQEPLEHVEGYQPSLEVHTPLEQLVGVVRKSEVGVEVGHSSIVGLVEVEGRRVEELCRGMEVGLEVVRIGIEVVRQQEGVGFAIMGLGLAPR